MIIRLLKKIHTNILYTFYYLKIIFYNSLMTFLDIPYDFKLGVDTEGTYLEKSLRRIYNTDYKDSNAYGPTTYYALNKIKKLVNFSENDVFLDLGCGKGRVLFFFSNLKLKKIIGIEIDDFLYKSALSNLKRFRKIVTPIEIHKIDAAKYKFSDETIVFMYNPFGSQTTNQVFVNLQKNLKKNPRKIKLLCYVSMGINPAQNITWLKYKGKLDNSNFYLWQS